MGAWGIRNFENDSAFDWLNNFFANPSREELQAVFESFIEEEAFLDSEESYAVLAAAKIGKESSDFPRNIDPTTELLFEVDEALKWSAIRAISKILYFEEHSELRELWQEADEYEEWVLVVKNLLTRLGHSER